MKEKFIVLYHRQDKTVKMTKRASYLSAKRSKRNFEKIGISPCEIVKVETKKEN